jgi:2-keto-4-pentenoate hydratase
MRARCAATVSARFACLAVVALLAPALGAGQEDIDRITRWIEALGELSAADGVLAQPPAGLSAVEAGAVRAGYVARLLPRRGPVVGYKAALTSPAAQARFGLREPVYGFLLRDMLASAGARLRRPAGPLTPMIEADLVVRVGSAALNDAATPREVLAGLDAILPFIELPALPFAQPPDAGAFVAANAGAWRGVLGTPLPLTPGADWARVLRMLEVTLATSAGTTLATGQGSDLLGDPVRVVIWLRDALRADGRRLEQGDLLSLGSLTTPLPVPWGQEIVATYRGLAAGPVTLSVRCE